MNSEMRSTMIWVRTHLIVLSIVCFGLIFITFLVDGRNPGDGIIKIYNLMFILFIMIIAGTFPLTAGPYIDTNIQFGANRKQLFWANEIATGIIIVISFLAAIGMNFFGDFIYGANDQELWQVTPEEWLYLFIGMLLIWKMSQRESYALAQSTTIINISGFVAFKECLIIGIGTGMCGMSLAVIRGIITVEPPISSNIINVLYSVVLILMCVGILILEHKSYRLFMKAEV